MLYADLSLPLPPPRPSTKGTPIFYRCQDPVKSEIPIDTIGKTYILDSMDTVVILLTVCLGVIGGGTGYVIAQAAQKRNEAGEKGSSDRDGARYPDPGNRWSTGPGLETQVIARVEALERLFTEQNQEITARFNRLAARQRRGADTVEPGPTDAPAQGLTRKQELRAKVAATKPLPRSVQEALLERGGRS